MRNELRNIWGLVILGGFGTWMVNMENRWGVEGKYKEKKEKTDLGLGW